MLIRGWSAWIEVRPSSWSECASGEVFDLIPTISGDNRSPNIPHSGDPRELLSVVTNAHQRSPRPTALIPSPLQASSFGGGARTRTWNRLYVRAGWLPQWQKAELTNGVAFACLNDKCLYQFGNTPVEIALPQLKLDVKLKAHRLTYTEQMTVFSPGGCGGHPCCRRQDSQNQTSIRVAFCRVCHGMGTSTLCVGLPIS